MLVFGAQIPIFTHPFRLSERRSNARQSNPFLRIEAALMSLASHSCDGPSRALGVRKPFQAIWHVAPQHPPVAARLLSGMRPDGLSDRQTVHLRQAVRIPSVRTPYGSGRL